MGNTLLRFTKGLLPEAQIEKLLEALDLRMQYSISVVRYTSEFTDMLMLRQDAGGTMAGQRVFGEFVFGEQQNGHLVREPYLYGSAPACAILRRTATTEKFGSFEQRKILIFIPVEYGKVTA